jgi:protein-tyrosine phosphatase
MLGLKAAPKIRVLMVCLGNICRSPTAEGVLRAKLQAAGLHRLVAVDSAGTSGLHGGEPPDARAIRQAAARGYDLSKQRARRVVAADFQRFDWVLAMDEANLVGLRRAAPPDATARLGLLMAHAQRFSHIAEVPDPYYGPPAGFDHVLDLVEDACDGLVERLAQELGNLSRKA